MDHELPHKASLRVAVIALVISLISASFSIWWSWHTYNQLLPLQSANVVLSDSGVIISNKVMSSEDPSGGPGDGVVLNIANTGKAAARNVRFSVYSTLFEQSPVYHPFDDKIIHELQPGAATQFGYFLLHYAAPGKANLTPYIGKSNVVILVHLQYEDTLTSQPADRIFLYQYILGTTEVRSIVGHDYSRIYKRLIDDQEIMKDAKLIDFLKANPPS